LFGGEKFKPADMPERIDLGGTTEGTGTPGAGHDVTETVHFTSDADMVANTPAGGSAKVQSIGNGNNTMQGGAIKQGGLMSQSVGFNLVRYAIIYKGNTKTLRAHSSILPDDDAGSWTWEKYGLTNDLTLRSTSKAYIKDMVADDECWVMIGAEVKYLNRVGYGNIMVCGVTEARPIFTTKAKKATVCLLPSLVPAAKEFQVDLQDGEEVTVYGRMARGDDHYDLIRNDHEFNGCFWLFLPVAKTKNYGVGVKKPWPGTTYLLPANSGTTAYESAIDLNNVPYLVGSTYAVGNAAKAIKLSNSGYTDYLKYYCALQWTRVEQPDTAPLIFAYDKTNDLGDFPRMVKVTRTDDPTKSVYVSVLEAGPYPGFNNGLRNSGLSPEAMNALGFSYSSFEPNSATKYGDEGWLTYEWAPGAPPGPAS